MADVIADAGGVDADGRVGRPGQRRRPRTTGHSGSHHRPRDPGRRARINPGSILGVTLLAAIANVLNLLDVASYLSDVTVGAFIVAAVGLRGPRTIRAGRQIAEAVRERRPEKVQHEPASLGSGNAGIC